MSYKSRFRDTLSTHPRWFEIWLKHFSTQNESGIWQARDKSSDIRFPYIRKTPSIGRCTIPMASAAVNSHTPRYDVLGDDLPADLGPCLQEMMHELGVTMLQFPYLSPMSRLLTCVDDRRNGVLIHLESCETAPYACTTGDWEAYWAARGKSRREWGRRERKFMNRPGARFVCLTQWDEIAPLWRNILQIEASGWKGRSGTAIIQHDNTLNFYTELAQWWAAEGLLRLFLLYDDTTPVAFELDAEYNGILHCFKHGYLESHAKQGPGQVLRIQILRWAFDRPDVFIFDMFGPDTEAKRKWATHDEELMTLKVFSHSPKGYLAWARYSLGPRLKQRISSGRDK